MKSFIILSVLLTAGIQYSMAQDSTGFFLNKRPAGASNAQRNGQAAARFVSPDSSLRLRLNHVRSQALADTSKFVPNRATDWSLFNAYASTAGQDSVVLETVIEHNRNLDWKVYQVFGRITDKRLWPRQEQEVPFKLLTDAYSIKVETNGLCSIRLMGGQLPPNDPVVLPISITFKVK